MTLTFTTTKLILTIMPPNPSLGQKTVSLNFEQVTFMAPRKPELSAFACHIVSLPKPWLMAFDMVTALRPASSILDVHIDVIPKTGVMVKTIGNACSRTLIEEVELYSSAVSRLPAGRDRLSIMIDFKEFSLAFEMALALQSMVNLYCDPRAPGHHKRDPGPMLLQVPSTSGIDAEFIISTLLPEDTDPVQPDHTGLSGHSVKRKPGHPAHSDDHPVSEEERDHVSESEYSMLGEGDDVRLEIPGTPPRK